MHSCRRILDPDLFSSIEHNIKQSKLERSDKHKIKSTSKSCRRFLYTILAVLPKVRLNLGLLGKKLIILQSVIRIEGINPFSGAVAGEAIATLASFNSCFNF